MTRRTVSRELSRSLYFWIFDIRTICGGRISGSAMATKIRSLAVLLKLVACFRRLQCIHHALHIVTAPHGLIDPNGSGIPGDAEINEESQSELSY